MEYEKILTLASVQRVELVAWDSLGQHILIGAQCGRTPEKTVLTHLALSLEAAQSLAFLLSKALDEKAGEEETMQ